MKFAQHERCLLLGGRRTDARGGTAGDSEVRAHCTEKFYDIAEVVFRRALAERRRGGIAGRVRFRGFCAGGGLFHCLGLWEWEAENGIMREIQRRLQIQPPIVAPDEAKKRINCGRKISALSTPAGVFPQRRGRLLCCPRCRIKRPPTQTGGAQSGSSRPENSSLPPTAALL